MQQDDDQINNKELHSLLDEILNGADEDAKHAVVFLIQLSHYLHRPRKAVK